jgi:hypothetical protein
MTRKINNNMVNSRDYNHIITIFGTHKSEIQNDSLNLVWVLEIINKSEKFIKEIERTHRNTQIVDNENIVDLFMCFASIYLFIVT